MDFRRPALAGIGDGLRHIGPDKPVLRNQHETGKIMLLPGRIAQPLGRQRDPLAGGRAVARDHPVIVLQLQYIEGRRRPANRQIGPLGFRRGLIEDRRQIGQQQGLHRHRFGFAPDRLQQIRRRLRQQRTGLIQHHLLRLALWTIDIRNADRIRAKGGARRCIIKTDPPVRHEPPPGLPHLETDRRARIARNCNKSPRHCLQIGHGIAIGRRQQSRGRLPAGKRRIAIFRPLLPVGPAMRIEQLVGQRQDHRESHRLGAR